MNKLPEICITIAGCVALLLCNGPNSYSKEPSAATDAAAAKTFTVPDKFSISDPGDGYQWSLHREMEHQGIKMRYYALAKEGSQSAIVLGVQERTVDSDPARITAIKGHYNGTWEGLMATGFTELKARRPKLEPPVPDRVEFSITSKDPLGGESYIYFLTVFGRSVYSVQAKASTLEEVRRMYEIANSFQELPAK